MQRCWEHCPAVLLPHRINEPRSDLSNRIKTHIWRTTGLDNRNLDIFDAAAVLMPGKTLSVTGAKQSWVEFLPQ